MWRPARRRASDQAPCAISGRAPGYAPQRPRHPALPPTRGIVYTLTEIVQKDKLAQATTNASFAGSTKKQTDIGIKWERLVLVTWFSHMTCHGALAGLRDMSRSPWRQADQP